jgi:hypothetical protein
MSTQPDPLEEHVTYTLHVDTGPDGPGPRLGSYPSMPAALDALGAHAERSWQAAPAGPGGIDYLIFAHDDNGIRKVGGGGSTWTGTPSQAPRRPGDQQGAPYGEPTRLPHARKEQ